MSQPSQTIEPQSSPGSLTSVLGMTQGPTLPRYTLGRADWARMGVLALLFVLLHLRQLDWTVSYWLADSNWTFGFLIPLFSLYLLYTRRDEIALVQRRHSWTGLVIMCLALIGEPVAILIIKNYWLLDMCMVAMLFGLVLYLGGWRLMKLLWLPIVYLALSIPWPTAVYTAIAYPLQEIAAAGSVAVLELAGVTLERTASNIKLWSRTGVPHDLTVAEACAGLRLLVAFFAIGVAIAYLEERPLWQRIVLVLAGIPIAVLCNVLRVTITSTMFYIDHKKWGEGVMHSFTGMIMLLPAFAMLFGLGWLLQRLFVEADEDDASGRKSAQEASA